MVNPSFGGYSIFGTQVIMNRAAVPRAGQRNEYGGLTGREYLDMGGRGLFTNVTGILSGSTEEALNQAQLIFDSYRDGIVYVLIDNRGNEWNNVLLDEFETVGRLEAVGGGGYRQAYRAKFEHLTDQ